jgi:hypothetical protein
VQTGAGNSGDDVVAGGGSGKSWRVRRKAAGEGNRAGVGRGRHVGSSQQEVERRQPGAKHCAGGRRSREGQHVPEEEEEREGVREACLKISEISGTSR